MLFSLLTLIFGSLIAHAAADRTLETQALLPDPEPDYEPSGHSKASDIASSLVHVRVYNETDAEISAAVGKGNAVVEPSASEAVVTTDTAEAQQKWKPMPKRRDNAANMKVLGMAIVALIWCLTVGWAATAGSQREKDKQVEGEFVKFRDGMQELGQVESNSNLVTLMFGDKELERLFQRTNADVLCVRVRHLCMAMFLYIALCGSLSESPEGKLVLNPRLFDLSTASGLVYNIAGAVIGFLCLCMLGLSFTPAFQKSNYLELLITSWIVIVIVFNWSIFFRWNLARNLHEDPEKVFVSTGSDGEFVASLQIVALYLCIHTPIRFRVVAPVVFCLPFLYLLTVLYAGSPEAWVKNNLHKLEGELTSDGDFLNQELENGIYMAFTMYLAALGKYYDEGQQRVSFMSVWESFKMVQELSDGGDSSQTATTGVGKANEALKQALGNLEALTVLQAGDGNFTEQLVLAKHQVELAKRILQRADKLFEVNADDALRGTSQSDNHELKEYINANMGGQTFLSDSDGGGRLQETNVADEAASSGTIHDSVRTEEVSKLAAGWGTDWGFSALELAKATKDCACLFAGELALVLSGHCDILAGLHARRAWVRAIHCRYLPNSYHNEAHAAQVSHFCLWFAKQTGWLEKADSVQSCALLLAALSHDVGHIGRTNLFCLKAEHSFALVWNESAPLENMHAATSFATMRGEADVLKTLDAPSRNRLRKAVIRFILATDIKEHHSSLAKLTARMEDDTFLIEGPSDSKEAVEKFEEDVIMAGEAIMKTSDIAHGMLPWEQHRNWSYRVNLEFFEQGDEEKSLGLPVSPLCDRSSSNIAGGQAFFIGHLCKDLFMALKRFAKPDSPGVDALEKCIQHGEANMELWKDEASDFDALGLNMQVILQKFGATLVDDVIYPYAFEKKDVPNKPVSTAEILADIAKYQHCAT